MISIFSDDSQAKYAVKRLVNCGFSRGAIDCFIRDEFQFLYPGEPFRFERFFQALLDDVAEAELYSIAASYETAVISVRTAGLEESSRVAAILRECGAVDICEWLKTHPTKFLQSSYQPEPEKNNTSRIVDKVVEERSRLLEERLTLESFEDSSEAAKRDLDSLLSTI